MRSSYTLNFGIVILLSSQFKIVDTNIIQILIWMFSKWKLDLLHLEVEQEKTGNNDLLNQIKLNLIKLIRYFLYENLLLIHSNICISNKNFACYKDTKYNTYWPWWNELFCYGHWNFRMVACVSNG